LNYFIKTPKLLHSLYRDAVWFLPNTHNEIYLTFDDGPIPGITDQCLDILKAHKVKATFFCVGENISKNPDTFARILAEGHTAGNHSYNHLKGWKTDNVTYFENVAKCQELTQTKLFRPPYGKIKRSQLKVLKDQYSIIMWDVLGADFDPKVSVAQCTENVLKNTESGSIIVLHDNEKCGEKMLQSLPSIIQQLQEKGFNFGRLPV
jgi:peptidoglycan/xylan/chitin deacetylase (PgdA/CDA1 family)